MGRYQPVFEMADAYELLPPALREELQACFDGDRNLAEINDTARRLVHHTPTAVLTLVVARLIALADEPISTLVPTLQSPVDLDPTQPIPARRHTDKPTTNE